MFPDIASSLTYQRNAAIIGYSAPGSETIVVFVASEVKTVLSALALINECKRAAFCIWQLIIQFATLFSDDVTWNRKMSLRIGFMRLKLPSLSSNNFRAVDFFS